MSVDRAARKFYKSAPFVPSVFETYRHRTLNP